MTKEGSGIAFGPVPSRRLGQSLGINNIPPKACTYSCVYCQVGRSNTMRVERSAFYEPEKILKAVEDKVQKVLVQGERIDYLTFVPDGEPTLDVYLGQEIELLKPLGIHIGVITSASLVRRKDVRDDLMKADWISLKIDSVREKVWRQINRPYGSMKLQSILDGILAFRMAYEGEIVTETMLVEGVNDSDGHIFEVAQFLSRLCPSRAYLSIPTRPPAESWVKAPSENTLNHAFQTFQEVIGKVEYLIGYEGNTFTFTGDVEEDLLSITAVHPMRKEAVKSFLGKAEADWSVVQGLIAQDLLVETEYEGRKYYLCRFPARHGKEI